MLALLGTSVGKYVAGGLALLLIVGGIALYVLNLRAEVSDAQAQVAAKAATINELQATNQANLQALADLRMADARAQLALATDATHQQSITQNTNLIRERVLHVPVPSETCRAADARDAAAIAGVRQLIGAAPADPDPNHQGAAPAGAAR